MTRPILHRVVPMRGEDIARAVGDPDAVFAREPVADLDQWLNRPRAEREIPVWELLLMLVAAAAMGAMMVAF